MIKPILAIALGATIIAPVHAAKAQTYQQLCAQGYSAMCGSFGAQMDGYDRMLGNIQQQTNAIGAQARQDYAARYERAHPGWRDNTGDPDYMRIEWCSHFENASSPTCGAFGEMMRNNDKIYAKLNQLRNACVRTQDDDSDECQEYNDYNVRVTHMSNAMTASAERGAIAAGDTARQNGDDLRRQVENDAASSSSWSQYSASKAATDASPVDRAYDIGASQYHSGNYQADQNWLRSH